MVEMTERELDIVVQLALGVYMTGDYPEKYVERNLNADFEGATDQDAFEYRVWMDVAVRWSDVIDKLSHDMDDIVRTEAKRRLNV